MRSAWVGVALLVGCAPPEPPENAKSEPGIQIAYPPRDVQTVSLQEDGSLELLVVVDIDNLTLQSPYEEGIDAVEGQGHWHATLGVVEGYQASFEPSLLFTLDANQVSLGITRLSVSLQSNLHDDLDQFEHWESSIEFELVEYDGPPDETGSTGDTGT